MAWSPQQMVGPDERDREEMYVMLTASVHAQLRAWLCGLWPRRTRVSPASGVPLWAASGSGWPHGACHSAMAGGAQLRPEEDVHKTSLEWCPSSSMPSVCIPAPPLLRSTRAGDAPDRARPVAAQMKGNPSTYAPVSAPSSASYGRPPSTVPCSSSYTPPVGILLPAISNSMSRRRRVSIIDAAAHVHRQASPAHAHHCRPASMLHPRPRTPRYNAFLAAHPVSLPIRPTP
jgi:hypothetical protein